MQNSGFLSTDIVNLAHEEYIESCVQSLKENLSQIFEKNDKIELNELTLLARNLLMIKLF